jgi:hypothetical protein
VSIDFEEMAAEQKRCPEMQAWRNLSSITFKQADIQRLVSDVSAGIFNPKVWSKFQSDIFFLLHIPHPGRLASLFIVSSRYVWCGLPRDLTAWIRRACPASRARSSATPR